MLDFEAVLRDLAASCLLHFLYRPRESTKRKPLRKHESAYMYSLGRKHYQPDQIFCQMLKSHFFKRKGLLVAFFFFFSCLGLFFKTLMWFGHMANEVALSCTPK